MNPLDALEALEREATPGPWVADHVEVSGGDGVLAQCGFGMREDAETQANARILATSRNILPEVIALARTVGDNIREDDLNGTYYLGEDTREALDALLRAISVDVEK